MTNEELLTLMQHTDADREFLEELQDKLRAELDKPIEEQDFDLIAEIGAAISAMRGTESAISVRAAAGIDRFKREIAKTAHTHRRIHIRYLIAACACAVIIVSNIWSYSVYGINSFSAAYRILNGGVLIDTGTKDDEPYAGNLYEADMRRICAEHDLDVLIPSYLPEDFTPTELYGDYDEGENNKEIIFYFKHQKATLNLDIIQFISEDAVVPVGIASDSHNITQQIIGQTTVHIQKEDHQFWAVFQVDATQYVLYADGVDYDECQRVLTSMFA